MDTEILSRYDFIKTKYLKWHCLLRCTQLMSALFLSLVNKVTDTMPMVIFFNKTNVTIIISITHILQIHTGPLCIYCKYIQDPFSYIGNTYMTTTHILQIHTGPLLIYWKYIQDHYAYIANTYRTTTHILEIHTDHYSYIGNTCRTTTHILKIHTGYSGDFSTSITRI